MLLVLIDTGAVAVKLKICLIVGLLAIAVAAGALRGFRAKREVAWFENRKASLQSCLAFAQEQSHDFGDVPLPLFQEGENWRKRMTSWYCARNTGEPLFNNKGELCANLFDYRGADTDPNQCGIYAVKYEGNESVIRFDRGPRVPVFVYVDDQSHHVFENVDLTPKQIAAMSLLPTRIIAVDANRTTWVITPDEEGQLKPH